MTQALAAAIADEPRMSIGRARAIAHRDARRTVAMLRCCGRRPRDAWRELTDLGPRQHLGWVEVEGLIAALVFADLIRGNPAWLAA